MGGQGRFQPCLLVDPMKVTENEDDKITLLKEIWPTVQEANQISPAHARVMKDFILIIGKDKPAERAGKGTVQRMVTLQLYEEEINRLYNSPKLPKTSLQVLVPPQIQQSETLHSALYQMVSESVWLDGQLSYNVDFFELGLDSLQTLALSKQINAYLMQSMQSVKPITPGTIYTHSSIKRLESVLTANVEPSIKETSHQKMQKVFSEWSLHLPKTALRAFEMSHEGPVVLLTGSTGSLGSYILQALLANSGVQKVYCLNRRKDAQSRQTQSFEAKGLKPNFPSIVFLQCDLSKQRFCLEEGVYHELLLEVTHVVHNAWDVNFNRPLDSFVNPHIVGLYHTIHFCAESRFNARLFFVSSESTVLGQHGIHNGFVPERIYSDWAYAQHTGYAESKLVAERIIDSASQTYNLRSTICRVGQVAGPTSERGIWSTREWFPSLIASSARLQMLPESLMFKDSVDWVPVDAVGQITVELLFQSGKAPDLPEQEDQSMSDMDGNLSSELPEAEDSSNQQHAPQSASREIELFGNSEKDQAVLDQERREHEQHSLNGLDMSMENADQKKSARINPNTRTLERGLQGQNLDRTGSHKAPQVFHVANSHPRPWQELIPVFQDASSTPLHSVPFPVWLVALQKQAESGEMVERLPAMALLEFFKDSEQPMAKTKTVLDTANAMRASKTLAAIGPVDNAWIGVWMRQWGLSKERLA